MIDNLTPTRGGPGFWAAGIVVRYGSLIDFMASKPWIRRIVAKVLLASYIHKLE